MTHSIVNIHSPALPNIHRLIIDADIEYHRRSTGPLAHRSPLNHSGGKGRAAHTLVRFISAPTGGVFLDANCGGCSIPLAFAQGAASSSHITEFRMRDTNLLLINFWVHLRDNPASLVAAIRGLVEPMWFDPDAMFAELIRILKANKSGIIDDATTVAAAYYVHAIICHPMGQFKLLPGGRAQMKTCEFLDGYALRLGQLFRWSALIQGWDFLVQDFRVTFQEAIALGDRAFILSDPPYEGTGKSSYDVEFSAQEHDELADLVAQANGAGARVMVTLNWSDRNAVRYQDFQQFFRLQDWPTRGKDREPAQEMVVLTYEAPHQELICHQVGWKTAHEAKAWLLAQSANDNDLAGAA